MGEMVEPRFLVLRLPFPPCAQMTYGSGEVPLPAIFNLLPIVIAVLLSTEVEYPYDLTYLLPGQ